MTATLVPPRDEPRLLQLDGLRGVAIALVLAHHLWPMPRVGDWAPPLGHVGVSLFFVLSGFLITRILLACRDRADLGAGVGSQLRAFYGRRFLRIAPPYYLALVALLALGVERAGERWIWHALYLSDWRLAWEGSGGWGGYDRHLWSLSVEEQFYLLWPALVMLLPRRLVVPAMVGAWCLAPAWRAAAWFAGWHPRFAELPMPANVDLLAAGALLAAFWGRRWLGPATLVLAIVAVPASAASLGPLGNWQIDWRVPLTTTLLSLALAGVVGVVATDAVPAVSRLLRVGPMVWLGTVSYAAYLVHTVTGPIARRLIGDDANAWAVGALATVITLGLSAASWVLIERPCLRLKARLRYHRPT